MYITRHQSLSLTLSNKKHTRYSKGNKQIHITNIAPAGKKIRLFVRPYGQLCHYILWPLKASKVGVGHRRTKLSSASWCHCRRLEGLQELDRHKFEGPGIASEP
jgi:hypothetical protein